MGSVDRKHHWERAWSEKEPRETSWYQSLPATSIKLIERSGITHPDPVIDVGGGASMLAGCLLDAGFEDVTVLDISAAALDRAHHGLGKNAVKVQWIEADVTRFEPRRHYALWHDRATFHFLVEPADRRRYVEVLHAALRPGGQAIIATFAPGGPRKCSGLDIVQYDAERLLAELGGEMEWCETCLENHRTPAGREQKFGFYRFRRRTRSS